MSQRQTGPERRRQFHTTRIHGAHDGVMRMWWAAWWAVAELRSLAKRSEPAAHTQGLALANQLQQFAARLNAEHHDNLKGGRRG